LPRLSVSHLSQRLSEESEDVIEEDHERVNRSVLKWRPARGIWRRPVKVPTLDDEQSARKHAQDMRAPGSPAPVCPGHSASDAREMDIFNQMIRSSSFKFRPYKSRGLCLRLRRWPTASTHNLRQTDAGVAAARSGLPPGTHVVGTGNALSTYKNRQRLRM
jgi:hypothetical protein